MRLHADRMFTKCFSNFFGEKGIEFPFPLIFCVFLIYTKIFLLFLVSVLICSAFH